MKFLDKFKKEKKKAKPKEKPVEEKKIEKKPEVKPGKKKIERRLKVEAWRVLKEPHVTEKSTDLAKRNQYVFRVHSQTNKTEIKEVIEDLYRVDVVTVRIVNIPSKNRRLGKTEGWRKGYKKAIISVKKGQKIELLPR